MILKVKPDIKGHMQPANKKGKYPGYPCRHFINVFSIQNHRDNICLNDDSIHIRVLFTIEFAIHGGKLFIFYIIGIKINIAKKNDLSPEHISINSICKQFL